MVVDTVEGRCVIRNLLADCGVYASTYSPDTHMMAYKEGKRSVGLWILEQFSAFPDLYIKFLTESPNE